jgi:branched-chain amino acid transport system ATP-binding protein
MAMLELVNVNVRFGKTHVLHDLSLVVRPGEVVALIGANAAGKTTTLRSVLGLNPLLSGEIRVAGERVDGLTTPQRVNRGLCLVPEGRQVFTRFSVMENLQMGAYHRADRDVLGPDIERVLQMFPRLAERRTQKAGSMSGGEQQMLAIGRGMMAQPGYLLLDEPTLGLAPIVVDEITTIVQRLAAEGMTILLAEQNAAMALACATRAYVLESGHISLAGDVAELRRSDTIRNLYLGG